MAEMFRKDPSFARVLLDNVLEDGYDGELVIVLRQMHKAFGDAQKMMKQDKKYIYQLCNSANNFESDLVSIFAILRILGLKLATQPLAAQTV